LTGHAELTIDPKQRLAIPAKYRSQWSEERDGKAWVCVPWSARQLRIYTEKTFEALSNSLPDRMTFDPDEANLESDLFGFAERIEEDSAGRITIPKLHLQMTQLGTDVVVVGARNRLEVRDRTAWMATIPERFANLPLLMSRVESKRSQSRNGSTGTTHSIGS
jgi:MraZ protein